MCFLHVLLDSFGLLVRILSSNTPDLYANKPTSRVQTVSTLVLSIIYGRLWVLHIILRCTNRSVNSGISKAETFPNHWFYLTLINLVYAALLMNINWNLSVNVSDQFLVLAKQFIRSSYILNLSKISDLIYCVNFLLEMNILSDKRCCHSPPSFLIRNPQTICTYVRFKNGIK